MTTPPMPAQPPATDAPAPDPLAVVADAIDGVREEPALLGGRLRRRLPAPRPELVGQVAEVVRYGHVMDGRVVRPQQVKVYARP